MRGSEFAEIRAFVAVARHASFARAASELGISRSALSQTIQTLEQRLGARLLNRTTRSVAPSEIGKSLLKRVEPLIAQFDDALGEVAAVTHSVSGTLRINAPRMAIVQRLASLAGPFLVRYPDVSIDFATEDRLIDVVAEGYDAGVRLGETIEKDMIAVPLGGTMRMRVAASPAYLERHGRPATPHDLSYHSCINLRRPTERNLYRWEFEREGRSFEVAVEGRAVFDEPAGARQAMIDGLGIAYLFDHDLTCALENGSAIALLDEWTPPFAGLYLYYPGRRVSPALRAFIDFIRTDGAPLLSGNERIPLSTRPERSADSGR